MAFLQSYGSVGCQLKFTELSGQYIDPIFMDKE